MELSVFGELLSNGNGIVDLMNDLGEAVALRPDMLTLGGGNPAAIPEIQALWRDYARRFLCDSDSFDKALACYDSPQGDPRFLDAFASLFRERFGVPITSKNVVAVSGAQQGAFLLFNMIAGGTRDGKRKKILTPLSPEYVGYAGLGVDSNLFISCPGKITYPDENDASVFKYEVDFNAVERALQDDDVSAILVSRPTNPSGNMISRAELQRLDRLAEKYNALLIIDSAYGGPFPGIVEDESELDSVFWTPRTALFYSLSKIGLPGLRTAFLIASEEIVERIATMNAIVALTNNSIGQRIALPMFESGDVLRVSREIVRPYYCKRRAEAIEILQGELSRVGVDARLHKSEGAFFLWLWIPGLTSGSANLYNQLKAKGVLAIPGDGFFYGLGDDHMNEEFSASRARCMRISFSSSYEIVARGLRIIAETIRDCVDADSVSGR